jgi:hypothetical protein
VLTPTTTPVLKMESSNETCMSCPICMDVVDSTKNCIITECGHSFHARCIMENITHNGFGCPYCRTMMVEEKDNDESTISTEIDDSDDDTISDDEPYSNSALHGMRVLFRTNGDEDLEDDDDNETQYTENTVSMPVIIEKFREKYQYEDLVKMICFDYDFRMCNNNTHTMEDAFDYIDEISNNTSVIA